MHLDDILCNYMQYVIPLCVIVHTQSGGINSISSIFFCDIVTRSFWNTQSIILYFIAFFLIYLFQLFFYYVLCYKNKTRESFLNLIMDFCLMFMQNSSVLSFYFRVSMYRCIIH